MKKIFFLFLLLGLLSACSMNQQTEEQTENLIPSANIPRSVDKIIKGLEGCTKEFAFEAMGLPMGEKTIDGKKYFEWGITTRYPENIERTTCTVHAHTDNAGVIDHIY
ncbi:MAG: hypothetical protein J5601_06175, partial [Elusimicrobiaceae bacterium]|nr:hypothetical protein [Elusimicrobiaceae bacterium]